MAESGEIASGNSNGVVVSSISSSTSTTSISSCCTTDVDFPSGAAMARVSSSSDSNAQTDAENNLHSLTEAIASAVSSVNNGVQVSAALSGGSAQFVNNNNSPELQGAGNTPQLGKDAGAGTSGIASNFQVLKNAGVAGSVSNPSNVQPLKDSLVVNPAGQHVGASASASGVALLKDNSQQVSTSPSVAPLKDGQKDTVAASGANTHHTPPASAAQNATTSSSTPPVVAQRQPQVQQRVSQPFICVPNQQAPYPHVQPQVRVAKGPVVVRHMTTAPQTAQRGPVHTQQQQHVHVPRFPHKSHVTVYSQAQLTSSAGSPQMPLRQPHPILPNQRMTLQAGTSRQQVSPAQLVGPGRSQFQAHAQRIPHPVGPSPRNIAGQPGAMMSASASPQPHLQHHTKTHHYKVGQSHTPQMNGSFGKSVPSWLPQIAQGGSNPNTPNDSHIRDRVGDVLSVIINDRKVRLVSEADKSSLYSLCRRWVRNDIPRKDQVYSWDCMVPLPRPLSAAEAEKLEATSSEQNGDAPNEEVEADCPVDKMTETELLQHHIDHFKDVRKRKRDQRMQRIARFKPRLALLLPPM